MSVPYRLPIAGIPLVVLAAAAVTVGAALLPAHRAARLEIAPALRFE